MPPARRSLSKPLAILACGAIAAGALAGPASGATASSAPELELSWRAPEGCPSAASVQAEFVRLLGGETRPPSSKRVDVEATVRRLGAQRWSVLLETAVDGVRGRRSLEGDSCKSVTVAAALILALTIDPTAVSRATPAQAAPVRAAPATPAGSPAGTSPPAGTASGTGAPPPSAASSTSRATPAERTPPPSPPSPPSPSPPAPAVPPPAPEETPRGADPQAEQPPAPGAEGDAPSIATAAPAPAAPPSLTRLFLRSFAGGAVALLPEPAAIVGLAVGVRHLRWELELSGMASQQRRAHAPERPSAGGDFRLLVMGARGCGRLLDGRVISRLCAGGELERLTARSSGVETPSAGRATLAAAVVTGVLAVPLGSRLELTMELAGSARVYRPKFTLTNLGPLFAVPAAAAVASLGLTVKL